MRRLFALLLLGIRALILHPIAQLFTSPERKGKRRFLSNYAGEALVPMSAADRAELPRFSGCVNCGLCDAICPLVGRAELRAWRGPSLFAIAPNTSSAGTRRSFSMSLRYDGVFSIRRASSRRPRPFATRASRITSPSVRV